MPTKVHICTLSGALADLPAKLRGSDEAVLECLRANPTFTVFDATEHQTLANTLDRLDNAGRLRYVPGGHYPWMEVEVLPPPTPCSPAAGMAARPSSDGTTASARTAAARASSPPAPERPMSEQSGWQPIETAPKDRTNILLAIRRDIPEPMGRPAGRCFVGLHPGLAPDGFDIGWSLYPGYGGVPDEWIAGWMPIPALPASSEADHG